MKKHIVLLYALLGLLMAGTAQATTLEDLYSLKVEVADQSQVSREKAITQAFDKLLVRITGDTAVPENEQVQSLRDKASRLVRQFRYETENVEVTDESTPDAPPVTHTRLIISITFDEQALNDALWKQRLPVWSKTRPAVLVWVAVQDSERRYLLDPNESSEFMQSLQANAERRGLPLLFPLMDLQDQLNINVSDVWANFTDTINRASDRYAPEAILVGRVAQDVFGNWQVRWVLYQGESSVSWTSPAENFDQIAAFGVDSVADSLARKYANVDGGESGAYWMEVVDVKNLDDYVRASDYLKTLSPLENMLISRVEADRVTYKLDLRGNVEALEQAISLGTILKAEASERFSERMLTYRLQP